MYMISWTVVIQSINFYDQPTAPTIKPYCDCIYIIIKLIILTVKTTHCIKKICEQFSVNHINYN